MEWDRHVMRAPRQDHHAQSSRGNKTIMREEGGGRGTWVRGDRGGHGWINRKKVPNLHVLVDD